MADRSSLQALKNLLSQTDLLLDTFSLPHNRLQACKENLGAAMALVDDLLKQQRVKPAAILGSKGGSATSKKHGPEHYRKMAEARKTHSGGRPRKQAK